MFSKRSIRRSLDRAAGSTGLVAWLQRRLGTGLTVLSYDRVLPTERRARCPLPAVAIPSDVFGEHVRVLANRFEVLPRGPALRALAADGARERPLVAVTFDDVYADNFEIAAPILEERGLRATFFPATDF